jgi:hypothetical protein
LGRPRRPRNADVEILASVKANELGFRETPQLTVNFAGEPAHVSASGSDRENIPPHVEAGVRYRDVRVNSRIAARLREEASDETA